LVTGIQAREADVADDRIRAGAHRDLVEADAVTFGERVPQPPGATVGVPVQLGGRPCDRLLGGAERPERPFVRRQLDDPLEPELALDLLDRLPRLVRHEPVENRADRRSAGPGLARAHVAGMGSGAVTYSPTISFSASASASSAISSAPADRRLRATAS